MGGVYFAAVLWFSPGPPVFLCHDIAKILLKVVLNTLTITLQTKKIM
jgi:hypothetical protein